MRQRMIAVLAALVTWSVAPAASALTFTLEGGGTSPDTSILPSLPGGGSVTATDEILSTAGYDYSFADVAGSQPPVSGASAISFRPMTDLELLAVPEPSTGVLVASGLALLAAARRRRSH